MEIYLVRHTTPLIDKGICYGQTDLDLVPKYLEEFQIVQQKIPSTIDFVYSSPLIRCKLLAEYLYSDIEFDNRLKEIDFGEWERQKWDDIHKSELNTWMSDFVNVAPPKGESFLNLYARVADFWEELVRQELQKVVIVTHAGVVRSIISKMLDIPLTSAFKLKLNYGSVSKISINGKMESVDYFNR